MLSNIWLKYCRAGELVSDFIIQSLNSSVCCFLWAVDIFKNFSFFDFIPWVKVLYVCKFNRIASNARCFKKTKLYKVKMLTINLHKSQCVLMLLVVSGKWNYKAQKICICLHLSDLNIFIWIIQIYWYNIFNDAYQMFSRFGGCKLPNALGTHQSFDPSLRVKNIVFNAFFGWYFMEKVHIHT